MGQQQPFMGYNQGPGGTQGFSNDAYNAWRQNGLSQGFHIRAIQELQSSGMLAQFMGPGMG